MSSVLPSIANEVLKSVVAQYNAIELIGKREAVCPALTDNPLAGTAGENGDGGVRGPL